MLARQAFVLVLLLVAGCQRSSARPERVWGKHGIMPGDLVKPRAIAIDPDDRLYLVDFTARVQAFDRDGGFLNIHWTTPDYSRGRPSGLSVDAEGNIVVSDSHYCCVRLYTPAGKLLRTVAPGTDLGEFGYISDALRDGDGNFYISEFGENHRITKLKSDGAFVKRWGEPGGAPGQFARIRAMALGPDGLLYVADSCNHRIQVFTPEGVLVRMFGEAGSEAGRLSYPYDVAFGGRRGEAHLYVVEFGNHRVQKFTPEGKSLGCWGGPGREAGRLNNPWALAVDSLGRVHVVDSGNDRVQRIDF